MPNRKFIPRHRCLLVRFASPVTPMYASHSPQSQQWQSSSLGNKPGNQRAEARGKSPPYSQYTSATAFAFPDRPPCSVEHEMSQVQTSGLCSSPTREICPVFPYEDKAVSSFTAGVEHQMSDS